MVINYEHLVGRYVPIHILPTNVPYIDLAINAVNYAIS